MERKTVTLARSMWLVVLAGLMLISGRISSEPILILPESSFDFGYAPQGVRINHTFWLKAGGDETLRITKVTPGCSCTKAPLERDTVAVGDSTRLEITFSTKRYKNRVVKTTRITSNEGKVERRITIAADVVTNPNMTSPLVIEPFGLDFTPRSDRIITELPFLITNTSEVNLEITIIDFPDQFALVNMPSKLAPGEKVGCGLSLTPAALADTLAASFTFEVVGDIPMRYTFPFSHTPKIAAPEE